jgi:hypothetical protein
MTPKLNMSAFIDALMMKIGKWEMRGKKQEGEGTMKGKGINKVVKTLFLVLFQEQCSHSNRRRKKRKVRIQENEKRRERNRKRNAVPAIVPAFRKDPSNSFERPKSPFVP